MVPWAGIPFVIKVLLFVKTVTLMCEQKITLKELTSIRIPKKEFRVVKSFA
jgi:hypothetical protein